jgi:hypothetical protein
MHVVALVATHTTTVDLLFTDSSDVALIAARLAMRSEQWELSFGVMFEGRHLPVTLAVTALTLHTVAPAMLVIRAVARNAIPRCFAFRSAGFVA